MKLLYILIIILFSFFSITWVYLDYKLSNYGRNDLEILNKTLPFDLELQYWDSDVSFPIIGYVIADSKTNRKLLGKGVHLLHNESEIIADEIMSYEFNNSSITACIKSSVGDYYSVFLSNKNDKNFAVIGSVKSFDEYSDLDTHIKIDNKKILEIQRNKNFIELFLLLAISFIMIFIYGRNKYLKQKR